MKHQEGETSSMCPNHQPDLKDLKSRQDEFTILKQLVDTILRRAQHKEDKNDLKLFLTNVLLFIQRVEGLGLSEKEKQYPPHSQFSHATFTEAIKLRKD